MHDTAYKHGRLFFELYEYDAFGTIVELGSQDVNGSLRDHCRPSCHYIGVDVMPAKGVDLVVHPGMCLPIASETVDAVVTSSAFEHDVCFWDTFLDLVRILRPGGLLYVNVPSNGDFHRHPLDCWRFYPDAGAALVQWAARRGLRVELVESFIGQPESERWADFVAVFRKAGGGPMTRKGRIADHAAAINIHDLGMAADAPLQVSRDSMPDTQIASHLRQELATAIQRNDILCADLAAATRRNVTLSADLTVSGKQVAMLSEELLATQADAAALRDDLHRTENYLARVETILADVRQELDAIHNSTSWRLTAGLRRLMTGIRGR